MADESPGVHPVPSGLKPSEAGSRFVRRNPRVLAFPLMAVIGSVAMFPIALEAVELAAVPAIWLLLVFVPDPGPAAALLVAAYPAFVGFIACMTSVVVFCNYGLIAATDSVRQGRSPSVLGGFAAAVRGLPHVLVTATVLGLSLMLVAYFEGRTNRQRRERFAARFGTTFTAATYLTGPAAVLDGASPVGMFRRSRDLLAGRFGPVPTVTSGPLKKYGRLGAVPLMIAQVGVIVGVVANGGTVPDWLTHPAVLVGAVGPLLLGFVYGSAVGTVVKTLLYVALREDCDRLPVVNLPVERVVDDLETGDGPGTEPAAPGAPEEA